MPSDYEKQIQQSQKKIQDLQKKLDPLYQELRYVKKDGFVNPESPTVRNGRVIGKYPGVGTIDLTGAGLNERGHKTVAQAVQYQNSITQLQNNISQAEQQQVRQQQIQQREKENTQQRAQAQRGRADPGKDPTISSGSRRNLAQLLGQQQTIATSSRGLLDDANTRKRKLLGG